MNSFSTEMHPNLRNCHLCAQEFHPKTLIPRVLTTCGHTFCTKCMTTILSEGKVCPLDKKGTPNALNAEELPIDTRIFAAFPVSLDLCPKHNKPLDLICLNEFEKKCTYCEEHCVKKRHNLNILSNIEAEAEAEAEEKKKILKKIEDDFESKYDEIDTLLNDHQEALLKRVENHFEYFQAEIKNTKDNISSTVKRHFEIQKRIADQSYNDDDQLRKQAKDFIQILDKKAFDLEFFKVINYPDNLLKIGSLKKRIEDDLSPLEIYIETITSELHDMRTKLDSLLRTNDYSGDFEVEENGVTGTLDSGKIPLISNVEDEMKEEIEEKIEEEIEEEIKEEIKEEMVPLMKTEEDYQNAVSLFYAEIEENNRLILSLKNKQRETESLFYNQEELKTINRVTLCLNKSRDWKEAIKNLQWIWNKLDTVIDLKIDFSFKPHAREVLEAVIEQSDIWASSDLSEFTIDLSASGAEDPHIIELYENSVSKMTNVEKLEIILEKTEITDHSVKVFAKDILPNLTNLNDFRLYLDNTNISDDAMEMLLTCMHSREKNLIGFALGLDNSQITDKTLEYIANAISPLASELLKLDLSAKNTNISNNGIKVLTKSLDPQLSKLKEYALDLGGCKEISNDGLQFFAQNTLKKMTSLETFELFVNEQKKTTNKTIKSMAKNLSSLATLKKIRLELGGTGIVGKALADLEKYALKNKPVLETFELYIAETDLDYIDINKLLRMKSATELTFQNLKKLSLCFSKVDLKDMNCKYLAKVIQTWGTNLQALYLQLGKTRITDTGLISLSEGLYKALQRTKITKFKLYLDSTDVTDKGLKVFSNQVVRSLDRIKTFELYLTLLQGVTDQGVEVLFTDLASVAESLKKIYISLYGTKITDNSFKALSQTLWEVKPKLESVALSFGKTENTTGESLDWCLCNFAPIFHNLKSLTLILDGTKITSQAIHLLEQYLQEDSRALEELEIDVGNDEDLKKIVQDLKSYLM